MSLKNTLIGTGLGLVAGSVLGVCKASTVLCPVVWIPGSVLCCANTAYIVSDGSVVATVVGGVLGVGIGVGCVAAYPIVAPIVMIEAMCMPVVGVVVGGVIGSVVK